MFTTTVLLLKFLVDPALINLDHADPLVRVNTTKAIENDKLLVLKIPFNCESPEAKIRMFGVVRSQILDGIDQVSEVMWEFGKRDPDFWKRLEQFSDERMGHREFNMIHGH